MINYDINSAAAKIRNDYPSCSQQTAENLASNLLKIRPELHGCLESWLAGNPVPFEFNGISLAQIEEKEKSGYIGALFRMSVLMDDPRGIEAYLNTPIYYL